MLRVESVTILPSDRSIIITINTINIINNSNNSNNNNVDKKGDRVPMAL